jgi:PAS domain S-box-containing protein
MSQSLRIMIVEDSEDDATLLQQALHRGGYEVTCEVVDKPAAMRALLENQDWDVITSDHAMPYFSAPEALKLAKELRPDLPFIIVSGEIDLKLAVSLMKGGAQDYIQKGELARLAPAIERELREVELRRERQQVEAELRISEIRYRRLFETAQDGILILDADTGKVIDVNPFLIAMLGYSRDEFLGKKLWELGAFKDIEASKNAYLVLQSQGYIRYDNLPLQTNNGRNVAVEFVSNVYLVDHTKIAQCNIRDITVREQALKEIHTLNAILEQNVRECKTQLESLNKELEVYNISVSHDLRASLRRIMSATEALQKDYSDKPKAKSMLSIRNIRFSAEHMNALFSALLELTRISRGELKRHAVDLSSAVHLISDELQEKQPDRQVEFVIAEGIMANGDDQLLRIVLENLLGNAWKFTSRRAHAQIEFGVEPHNDGKTAYFVRDDGAGFDMNYADRLFNPFERLHGEKEFPGIGIGLATVQRIIQRQGGRVWAKGEVGKGATFYFTIGGG